MRSAMGRGGRGRREGKGKGGRGKAVSIQSKLWSSLQGAQSTGCSRPERSRCLPVLRMPSSPHGYHRACLASNRTMLTATPQHTNMPQTAAVTPAPAFNSPTKLRLGAPAPKNNLTSQKCNAGCTPKPPARPEQRRQPLFTHVRHAQATPHLPAALHTSSHVGPPPSLPPQPLPQQMRSARLTCKRPMLGAHLSHRHAHSSNDTPPLFKSGMLKPPHNWLHCSASYALSQVWPHPPRPSNPSSTARQLSQNVTHLQETNAGCIPQPPTRPTWWPLPLPFRLPPPPSQSEQHAFSHLQQSNTGRTPQPPACPQQRRQPLCTHVRQ